MTAGRSCGARPATGTASLIGTRVKGRREHPDGKHADGKHADGKRTDGKRTDGKRTDGKHADSKHWRSVDMLTPPVSVGCGAGSRWFGLGVARAPSGEEVVVGAVGEVPLDPFPCSSRTTRPA